MNAKKRVTLLFMVLCLFLGVLSPSMNLFAVESNKSNGENEAGIYEVITILADDKKTADVKVTIQPKENITVNSVILPNGEEKKFNVNTVEFQMAENGAFSFGLKYQSAEETEVKTTEIFIEISGIEKNSNENDQVGTSNNLKDTNVIKNFNLTSVKRTSTGIAPFDADDNSGNDSSASNNIVRSFDSILYDMTYSGEMNTEVESADIEFELSLNVSKKYAEFNIDVLSSWMTDITQEDVDGKCVLKGKTAYKYIGGDIGGFQVFSQTRVIEVNVKGMNQFEQVIPTFKTRLLNSNDQWKEKIMDGDTEKAIVSAIPMYDIELVNANKAGYAGVFDFSSGTNQAPNKDVGNVNGRLMDFGVGIRLKAIDSDKGMKGFYIPEKNDNLTFTINTTINDSKGNQTGDKALLWDWKENKRGNKGENERDLTNGTGDTNLFSSILPLTDSNGAPNSYTVNNGGTWAFKQNPDGSIEVSVSGASLYNQNGEIVAPTLTGTGTNMISPTPSQGNLYLSTALFEVVVPIEKDATENKKYQLVVTDSDMKVQYQDGIGNDKIATEQTVTTNDSLTRDYEVMQQGNYGLFHYLVQKDQQYKFWGENLSSNKAGMGLDAYALKGDTIQVVGAFSYVGDDTTSLDAINLLMRIDDKAMQPSNSSSKGVPTSSNIEGDVKLLYATKKGGAGWTSEDEMEKTKENELEYFETMVDLKKKYPNGVCIAVLAEARNIKSIINDEQYTIGFNVDILETAKENEVYQNVDTIAFYNKNQDIEIYDSRLDHASSIKLDSPIHYIRENNHYEKAEYNDEHQVINGNSKQTSYIYGASLLVVGVEAGIQKEVDSNVTTFDISNGITFIPYRLQPVLNVAKGKEGITIKEIEIIDVLPKQLEVTEDTKYFYGDKEITPTIKVQSDGSTKLTWKIENVKTGEKLPELTFNAEINFDNIDLKQSKHNFSNTAYIEATGDNRAFSSNWASHPNKDNVEAQLVVGKSLNLSKVALEPLVEVNGDVKYRIAFTNTDALDYTNYKMLDILPYNGDENGSKFAGKYSIGAKLTAPLNIELYYSSSTDVRGKKVTTVDENLFQKIDPVSEDNGKKNYVFPEDTTAIILKGTLPTMTQYVLDITMHSSGEQAAGVFYNSASMVTDGINELTTPVAKVEMLERSLSGIAWIDTNKNGVIDNVEEKLSGLTTKLYITNPLTGMEQEAFNLLGEQCVTKTDKDGKYEFKGLSSGEYRIVFLDENGNPVYMSDYTVTKKEVGKDEKINSKADAVLSDVGVLNNAQIDRIKMPTLGQMNKDKILIYKKEYQNLGIYKVQIEKSVTKVWDDNNNQDGIRPNEVKVQLYANGKAIGSEIIMNEANNWKHTFSNLAKYEKGKEIEYTVKEVEVANGYTDKVEVEEDGSITVINTHIPAVIEKSVTKVWDDNNNQDGIRPNEVKVQLYANGKAIGSEIIMNEANNWKHTFSNLAKYEKGKEIEYTVKEVEVANGYTDKVEVEEDGSITVINTHIPAVIEKSVTKVWDDNNNQDGIRPNEVKVQLYANGKATGSEIIMNEANNWKHTFSNLAKYEKGKEIEYTVKEVEVAKGYTDKVEVEEDGNFIITNTYISNNPVKPELPNESNKPEKPSTSPNMPQTGDTSNTMFWVSLIVTSCVSIFTLLIFKKRKHQKH